MLTLLKISLPDTEVSSSVKLIFSEFYTKKKFNKYFSRFIARNNTSKDVFSCSCNTNIIIQVISVIQVVNV